MQLKDICHIKLFTPTSIFTWYIIEISKDDKDTCYGLVKWFESELGYFSLWELEIIKGNLGVGVERDISFIPTSLEIVKKLKWEIFMSEKKFQLSNLWNKNKG